MNLKPDKTPVNFEQELAALNAIVNGFQALDGDRDAQDRIFQYIASRFGLRTPSY